MSKKQLIRKRVSVIVLHEDKILGFHAEDPTSQDQYFFLPGGKIEKGESPVQAAVRETLEETGYRISVPKEPKVEKKYDFQWDGQVHICETVFYIGFLESTKPAPVTDASYHRGVNWILATQRQKIFSYNKEICDAVEYLVRKIDEKNNEFPR